MPVSERFIMLLAFIATLVVVFLICSKGLVGPKPPGHAGIADNETMHADADSEIVGDSNITPDPVSRVALANTRFLTGPLCMPMLRQTNIGGRVRAGILNNG